MYVCACWCVYVVHVHSVKCMRVGGVGCHRCMGTYAGRMWGYMKKECGAVNTERLEKRNTCGATCSMGLRNMCKLQSVLCVRVVGRSMCMPSRSCVHRAVLCAHGANV